MDRAEVPHGHGDEHQTVTMVRAKVLSSSTVAQAETERDEWLGHQRAAKDEHEQRDQSRRTMGRMISTRAEAIRTMTLRTRSRAAMSTRCRI